MVLQPVVQPSSVVQDFLKVNPLALEFRNVRGVVLDPSCSGSGTSTARTSTVRLHGATTGEQTAPAAGIAADQTQDRSWRSSGAEACAQDVTGFPGVTSDSSERVLALARFQTNILKHALQFPALERLTYSTCSVFREENEDVVAAVLPFAIELGLDLAPVLPKWYRRGLQELYPWVDKVVRVHPELDASDGFFVALFERQTAR
jgi:25S rRNA (cytosine2278-C5)-methyltransferase